MPSPKICQRLAPKGRSVMKNDARMDHISRDIIRKFLLLLNQIELNTSHTIIDTGTA